MNILNLVFPKNCVNCGKPGNYLCKDCVSQVPQAKSRCPLCENYNFQGKTHPSCYVKNSLDGHVALWAYKGVIRKAILRLKYNFVSDLASELVCISVEKQKTHLNWRQFEFVAIPVNRARLNWRGFNQSEILAELFAKRLNGFYQSGALIKTKNTKPQAQLDQKQRARNIKNAFSLSPKYVAKGKRVVLVDDVWTTGSTMREAGKVLKKAGASEVWGLTVAA